MSPSPAYRSVSQTELLTETPASKKGRNLQPAGFSFSHVQSRRRLCIWVHILVVVVRLLMVVVWATGIERRVTLSVDLLSHAASVLNFGALLLSAAILALTTWAMRPLMTHVAWASQQSLTAMHDRLSALDGPSAAGLAVWRNIKLLPPVHLLILLVYFIAAWGVGSTFSPAFTLESYNVSVKLFPAVNSITTALGQVGNPIALLQTAESNVDFLLASAVIFPTSIPLIPGLGYRMVHDTLAWPGPTNSQTNLSAMAFTVVCGQVPQEYWRINVTQSLDRFILDASTTLNQRTLRTSFNVTSDNMATAFIEGGFLAKLLEEDDPAAAPPSPNIYVFGFATSPSFLPYDSEYSLGSMVPLAFGPSTGFAKVIGCSLISSNRTVTLNGLNLAINGTNYFPPPDPHPWSNVTFLPSRGIPFEDGFSYLYSKNLTLALKGPPYYNEFDFSMFEHFFSAVLQNRGRSLSVLEEWLANCTSISIAALAWQGGYENVDPDLRALGWDPKPTQGVSVYPVLRARLKMTTFFTLVGFGFSIILLIAAVVLIQDLPAGLERLIDNGLLFTLYTLRHSPLPTKLGESMQNRGTLIEDDIRQVGLNIQVRMSENGQLVVVN